MAGAATHDAHVHPVSDPVWRILTGTAAFAAGVFVCGSVGSYVPTDPSWNAATSSGVNNLFGATGAVFSDIARQTLGWSSWAAGMALMVGGSMRAVLIGAPRIRRWLMGTATVPLSAACFASWPVPASWPFASGLGGMVGDGLLSLAEMPFKALLMPMPTTLAGFACGAAALLFASRALGFQRGDAQLLQEAAASSAVRTARKAWLGGGAIAGLLSRLRRRNEEDYEYEEYEDEYDDEIDADIIIADEEYDLSPSSFLPGEDIDEDEYYEDDGEDEGYFEDEPELDADEDYEVEHQNPAPAPPPVPIRTPAAQLRERKPVRSPDAPRVRRNVRRKSTKLPPIELLKQPPSRRGNIDEEALLAKAARLAEVLQEFGVRGRIKEVRPGPVVTLFEMEPAPGVKSARVISLADDVARSMSANSARMAVVPGKNAIGIELPNEDRETVYLRSLLQSDAYKNTKASLPMALGDDIGGAPTVVDLAKMPHLLIAGTTGSGKSVGVNAMILSLIYKHTPEQCRFIMIDPKMLELSIYEGIPHLLAPVVTDPSKAVNALKWTVREMESRYELMSKAGVRNLAGFNDKAKKHREAGKPLERKVQTGFDGNGKAIYETETLPTEHIPNIVVVVDEMADLMMVAGKEIEGCIQRLAQMARAAGIHLITATQRPSVDVITGTIKANFPTRISYMVTTKIDSRTILGEQGAEQLLGMGDLLYQAPGKKSKRCHGPFVSDEEVEEITDWLRGQGEPDYCPEVLEEPEEGSQSAIMDAMLGTSTGDKNEDLYAQAVAIVVGDQRASTSYLQRRLKVGYNKAANLIERMEEEGVISSPNHAGKREIFGKPDPEPA